MTNKPKVKRYDDMGCPEQICRVDTMYESDDGDYVLYEDYEALQAECEKWKRGSEIRDEQNQDLHSFIMELKAECEKLREHLQNLIDQTTPLEPVPGNPMWSRRIQLDEVMVERDQLRAECEELRIALAESRANDRQAMYYLNQVREIVGGDDFPDMVERCRELIK